MRYRITGIDGRDKVEVDAVDWMMAMSKAIQMFGIEVSGWVCDTRADGDTVVTDPASGRSWLVHQIAQEAPAFIAPPPPPGGGPGAPPPLPSWLQKGAVTPKTISPVNRKVGLSTLSGSANIPRPPELTPPPKPAAAPPAAPTPVPVQPPRAAAPPPAAPSQHNTAPRAAAPATGVVQPRQQRRAAPKTGVISPADVRKAREPVPAASGPMPASGPPNDLAERLFDVSMDIAMAGDVNSACSTALQIALDLVPCEAGSVLRGGINESELKFVAVSGPAASQLLGRAVPFGKGIAGATFDMGITIQVNDVAGDTRHDAKYDKETGFITRSVLCVPVRSQTDFYGCLQLLNPPKRFEGWHVEVAETVARSLAATLEAALG